MLYKRAMVKHLGVMHGRSVSNARSIQGSIHRPVKRKPTKQGGRTAKKHKHVGRGSRTKTLTKSKSEQERSGAHSDLLGTDIKINHGRIVKKTIGKWIYQQTHSSIITSASGLQYFTQQYKIASPSQLLVSTGAGYSGEQNFKSLQSLNPYGFTTGNNQTLTSQVIPKTDCFIIKSVNVSIEISNMGPDSCYFDLYVVRAKKNCEINMDTAWQNGMLDQYNVVGATAIVNPGAGNSAATFGGAKPDIVGTKPGDSKLFRDYFQIDAVKHINMSGGATHNVNVDIIMNKLVKVEETQELLNRSVVYQGGLTTGIMYVFRGQVGIDTTSTTANERATYLANKLASVSTVKYHCCAVPGQASRVNSQFLASGVPSGATTANQQMENVVDVAQNLGAMFVP